MEDNTEQLDFAAVQKSTRLYEYIGTISERVSSKTPAGIAHVEIKLEDRGDYCKAPTVIHAYAGLAEYIEALLRANTAERHLNVTWCYGRDMVLRRIVVKTKLGQLAKIITVQRPLDEDVTIFGPKEFLETDKPAQLRQVDTIRWCRWVSANGAVA